ncbi:LysR family transcriptional regulator [Streptomyces griseoviridis]|uniref:LysR family transcriptional regulator n=1 Tax=Streptomyces griseoviridis TaxID=45398 RepID=A0A918G5A7_STRGD|nr:LysR family transcriptional regulator [Streptomyces niveoruber]GGS20079.1 LysR family transcriptional regulator [Streptomyces niveoruber]
MDTEAVRSFVRAAELGQLGQAADELGVTQQAVSKRIAALEREVGVRLFARTARGVEPTLDGQAFLPHARSIVAGADRAVASVRPGSRALRIDVLGFRSAQAVLLRAYWRTRPPGTDLDVVTLRAADPRVAAAAVRAGEVDAAFRTVTDPAALPPDVRMAHAFSSPLQVLVGPRHPLAGARAVTPERLRPHRIWVPGIAAGSEWSEFYDQLADAFGLRVDAAGPHFGDEALLDTLADSADVATLVGARDRYVWPAAHDLRRIPVVDPVLAYPISLLLPRTAPHPELRGLLDHFAGVDPLPDDVWLPSWPTVTPRRPGRGGAG